MSPACARAASDPPLPPPARPVPRRHPRARQRRPGSCPPSHWALVQRCIRKTDYSRSKNTPTSCAPPTPRGSTAAPASVTTAEPSSSTPRARAPAAATSAFAPAAAARLGGTNPAAPPACTTQRPPSSPSRAGHPCPFSTLHPAVVPKDPSPSSTAAVAAASTAPPEAAANHTPESTPGPTPGWVALLYIFPYTVHVYQLLTPFFGVKTIHGLYTCTRGVIQVPGWRRPLGVANRGGLRGVCFEILPVLSSQWSDFTSDFHFRPPKHTGTL